MPLNFGMKLFVQPLLKMARNGYLKKQFKLVKRKLFY